MQLTLIRLTSSLPFGPRPYGISNSLQPEQSRQNSTLSRNTMSTLEFTATEAQRINPKRSRIPVGYLRLIPQA